MTPPIFNLGDEVIITGKPLTLDTDEFLGKRFTIDTIGKRHGEVVFSDAHMPWYPASSLRLVNEKPLSPMQVTCTYDPVDCECRAIQVSCPCGRKAEIAMPAELKIGDWVEVIGPDVALNDYYRGRRFRISQTPCQMSDMFSCEFYPNYFPAESLRKLTPAEVAEHTSTFTQECQATLDKAEEALRRVLAPSVDKRLSAIEKQLEEQQNKIGQFNGEIGHLIGSIQECLMEAGDVDARTKCREIEIEKRLSAIETLQFSQQDAIVHFENRLTFVEKFQRDQDNLMGRAIRDGVAEILDFRRKA